MVSLHPTKFGGHRHCDSGDIIVLVCHLILQDHMIKVSYGTLWERGRRGKLQFCQV